jgi:aryl-alcohol dehydrogenase-like predicted oxidoreductase
MKFRLFGKSGLRVSEVALGTMTFGTNWGWGADRSQSQAIFEAYVEAGGNSIDTANRYTEGSSETWVGEMIQTNRDRFVLATKYSLYDKIGDPNFSGNHRKNLMRSVEQSLNRLNTDFIDVLWLLAWDFHTPIEEVMRGLDDLVRSGKVHYIGVSDTPAWVVSAANVLAQLRGWTPFTGLQVEYSLLQRTPERDLIPMARQMELCLTPWAPLAGGALTGKYLKGDSGRVAETSTRRNERNNRIVTKVMEWSEKLAVSPAALAVRWTMQQPFTSIPIIGARTQTQILDSLHAIQISIPDETMKELNEVSVLPLLYWNKTLSS